MNAAAIDTAARCIAYRDGYKYQLAAGYFYATGIYPAADIITEYVQLNALGGLHISEGYAWDGPSGPTIDTENFMRGSLVHDALYQLMRAGHLDAQAVRPRADALLRDICRADGMSAFRAWYVYHGVRLFAGFAAEASPLADRPRYAPAACGAELEPAP